MHRSGTPLPTRVLRIRPSSRNREPFRTNCLENTDIGSFYSRAYRSRTWSHSRWRRRKLGGFSVPSLRTGLLCISGCIACLGILLDLVAPHRSSLTEQRKRSPNTITACQLVVLWSPPKINPFSIQREIRLIRLRTPIFNDIQTSSRWWLLACALWSIDKIVANDNPVELCTLAMSFLRTTAQRIAQRT